MKQLSVCSLFAVPATIAAFTSIPADPLFNRGLDNTDDFYSNVATSNPASVSVANSAPWRVAMDIGREPLARMPSDWARSGCRMPLVFPCDFSISAEMKSNILQPHSKTVSFTGPDGAVVKPIEGRKWSLSKDSKELTCCFTVPERMERRDVYIEAGTDLYLSGRVYTQTELDQLNKEYYKAREELWAAGGELGDIYDRQEASKKWNKETEKWEKRYSNENPLKFASKQLIYWGVKAKQHRIMNMRPDLNTLSERGSMPGVEGGIYVAKGGVVRAAENGPICGTWYAEPVTGMPISYRGN